MTAKLVFAGAIAFSLEKLDVSLKAEQRSAIKAMYEGRDVFVCLPTGYGNSLCYQTLPFVMDHKDNRAQASAVLVVSPLIAHLHSSLITHRSYGRAGPTIKRARCEGFVYSEFSLCYRLCMWS